MNSDDRTDTDSRRKNRFQTFKVAIARFDDFPATMEANNLRLAGERAKHQYDPLVFFHMRDCFHTAAGQVEISNRSCVDGSERFAVFRRTVDVTFSRKWCGRHKKHPLCRKPISQFIVDRLVNFTHSGSPRSETRTNVTMVTAQPGRNQNRRAWRSALRTR